MAQKAEIPNDYPAQIRRLRDELRLTQAELADRLGVAFATVNRWENSQTRPSGLAWRRLNKLRNGGVGGTEGETPPASVPPALDFTGNPAAVRVIAEGERLTFGHLFNDAFATEISQIDPLPHQRIAVYDHLLRASPLRFLLADDAGAGKTIMSGLYIREMLARRLLRRVLIVPRQQSHRRAQER